MAKAPRASGCNPTSDTWEGKLDHLTSVSCERRAGKAMRWGKYKPDMSAMSGTNERDAGWTSSKG